MVATTTAPANRVPCTDQKALALRLVSNFLLIFLMLSQVPVNLSKVLYSGGFWGVVFGLLEASKTAPLKPHPKNRAPKNVQNWLSTE